MPLAARITDPTPHPALDGGPGVPTVLIEGKPAAVAADVHGCMIPIPVPHPPTPFPVGSKSVLIGGLPALRVGDISGCGAPIMVGAFTVMIGD